MDTIRQRDLIRREPSSATIVGCGSLGRQVAIMLTCLGITELTLYDGDRVSEENLCNQGFAHSDIGRFKVTCVEEDCLAISPAMTIHTRARKFDSDVLSDGSDGEVVFACVDNMDARKMIFDAYNRSDTKLLVDGRTAMFNSRVLAVFNPATSTLYEETLFEDANGMNVPCTAKGTLYCSYITAGYMVRAYGVWLNRDFANLKATNDLLVDILYGSISSASKGEVNA
jgi:molybdopterin/thiamine biosynthesis adenylyltransferase